MSKANERLSALKEEKTAYTSNEAGLPVPVKTTGKVEKITPERFNDILVGLTENVNKLTEGTFSRSQIVDLKAALMKDMEAAITEGELAELEASVKGWVGEELEKAVQSAQEVGEQARLIKQAREQYKKDSELIDQIDDSILFSKIDKGSLSVPEKMTKALENMEPSQAKLTMDALKRSENYGEVIPQVQRHILEQAVKVATKNGVENFNPRLFLQNLPEKATFDILFEGAQAHKEIREVAVLLKRMWKYEPTRGNSKTAQRQQADRGDMDILKAGVDAAQGKWFKAFSSLKDKISLENPEKIAEMLISPEKRQQILKYVGQKRDNTHLKATVGRASVQTGIKNRSE